MIYYATVGYYGQSKGVYMKSIYARTKAFAGKSGTKLESRHMEAAKSYPGTSLEQEFLRVLLKYNTLQTGMTLPFSAESTGLLYKGMTVESDDLSTEVNLNKLDFSRSVVEEGEGRTHGKTILPRADKYGAVGGLWLARKILDAREKGDEELKKIIPFKKDRPRPEISAEVILLPRTVVRWDSYQGERYIPYLSWGAVGRGHYSVEFLCLESNMIWPVYCFATPAK
jgi:hypothetical protein